MKTILLSVLTVFLFLDTSSAQTNHPLEPISKQYQTLAGFSTRPNPDRIWMDTICYPWSEYSKSAITHSLWRTVYLSADDEARLPTLIQFPANSSDQTRAELDYLSDLQNKRTPSEITRAEYIANFGSWPDILNPDDSDFNENKKELFFIATPVIGKWYNNEHFPATTRLLMNCIQDIRVTEFRLKWHFKRARPYHLEPKLQPLARIHSPSFASGHSLWAFTEAYLFSEIIPEKRTEFLERAEEVRWSRELMGIHYPSDNEASRKIGWYLIKYWYHNPRFKEDMKEAIKEWSDNKNNFK
jgi:acid phosphatase (class A)